MSHTAEPYKKDYILPKRPVFLRSLLFIAMWCMSHLNAPCHIWISHVMLHVNYSYHTWFIWVGSLKIQVSFAEYSLFYRALLYVTYIFKEPTHINHVWYASDVICVTSESAMSRVNDSYHTWSMSHLNEPCHVWMNHVMSRVKNSCHVWLVSHLNQPYHTWMIRITHEWLRPLLGSWNLWVSFAKEPYKRDDILQKRPIILSILFYRALLYGYLAEKCRSVYLWGGFY